MEDQVREFIRTAFIETRTARRSGWLAFSKVSIDSGMLAIMDPMLFPGIVIKVIAGEYDAQLRVLNDSGAFSVAAMRAVRTGTAAGLGRYHGLLNVDFARVTLGDLAAIERSGREMTSAELSGAFLRALEGSELCGILPWGVYDVTSTPFVRTPYGDGCFPVYELSSSAGAVGAQIIFIEGA